MSGLSGFSMFDLFKTEVENNTAILTEGLLGLEEKGGCGEVCEPLMRAAHSVKGAARVIGLSPVVDLAHKMEDCFVAAQKGELTLCGDGIDVLLRGVDMMQAMANAGEEAANDWNVTHGDEYKKILSDLAAVLSGELTTPNPAQEQPTEPAPAPANPVKKSAPSNLSGFSMFDLFTTEVENNSAILTDGLLGLEEKGGCGDVCEPLMRAAHSVKGAARVIGLSPVVDLAHKMEDCFVAAQKGELTLCGDGIDVLLRGVDTMLAMANAGEEAANDWNATHGNEFEKILADLSAVLAGTLESPSPASKIESPENPQPAVAAETKENPEIQENNETSPSAKPAAKADKDADRIVRVTAAGMDRLLGLAGEAYVQTQWFEPFADSLMQLRRDHYRLASIVESAVEAGQRNQPNLANALLRDTQYQLRHAQKAIVSQLQNFESAQRRMSNLAERLYSEVIHSRMRPFSDGVGGFPRMIRDLARQLDKKVKLEIVGNDTEIDRDILEKLEAPLTHLLRNSIDHGIESPANRLRAGKNETGRIVLEAAHRAGMLHIELRDDGGGVDIENLRKKVVKKGMTTAAMAEEMTSHELLEFLFLPSFSTRDNVTETSGRGVGLDVVQNMVQEVGGNVSIDTTPGEGTRFHLQLPLTLSVIRSLLMEVSGEPYAMPLYRVERCVSIPVDEILVIENKQYIELDGKNVGLVGLNQILDLPESELENDLMHIVVICDRQDRYGLQVDSFLGEKDLVVRRLDPRLGKLPDISAAAIMEDGNPLLIMDADDLLRSAQALLTTGRLRTLHRGNIHSEAKASKRILVVDDSITVREVQRRLLESAGYDVDVAVDGADGWNAIRSDEYDLLISDVDMPRMNGIELVRHVKQDSTLKDLPVMIVSYKDREEDRQRGLEVGADYYLAKSSFHDDTLLDAVEDLIGGANN